MKNYVYVALFVGLLLGGETILLPALYLGVSGIINIVLVVLLSVIAGVVSDSLWYMLGRKAPQKSIDAVLGLLGVSPKERYLLERALRQKGLVLLFFSKFVYGTRILTQILCGMINVTLTKYLFVNTLGILTLNALLIFLVVLVKGGLGLLPVSWTLLFGISLALLGASAFGLHILFRKFVWKKGFRL